MPLQVRQRVSAHPSLRFISICLAKARCLASPRRQIREPKQTILCEVSPISRTRLAAHAIHNRVHLHTGERYYPVAETPARQARCARRRCERTRRRECPFQLSPQFPPQVRLLARGISATQGGSVWETYNVWTAGMGGRDGYARIMGSKAWKEPLEHGYLHVPFQYPRGPIGWNVVRLG